MVRATISPKCRDLLARAGGDETLTTIFRTKSARRSGHEIRTALDVLTIEKMATRRSEFLTVLKKRYGKGPAFRRHYRESRLEAQRGLCEAAPDAINLWICDAVAVTGTKAEILDLASRSDVESVDVNPTFDLPEVTRTPLDQTGGGLGDSAEGVAAIQAPETWSGFGRGEDVLVGVLDSGVDATHPALQGKIAAFREFDTAGCALGTAVHDSQFHGTHVAGTICGRRHGSVNIGVAPEARIAAALVLPEGRGSFAQIVSGMQWALLQGCDVINLSLESLGYDPIWNLPILTTTFSGCCLVAPIMKAGLDPQGGPGSDPLAFGVGAIHREENPSAGGYQSVMNAPWFGIPVCYRKPEFSAPGLQVLSAAPGGGLALLNGASMAAPHVAGAIALLLSAAPALKGDPFAVRSIFFAAAREGFGLTGKRPSKGLGRLNVLSAAEAAVSLTS